MALTRQGELSLNEYKCEVQESCLQIAKYQKAIEDKYAILVENEAKILSLKDELSPKN